MTTAYEKLAGVVGQIIVENAKLGEVIETLRAQLASETARANTAELRLKDIEEKNNA